GHAEAPRSRAVRGRVQGGGPRPRLPRLGPAGLTRVARVRRAAPGSRRAVRPGPARVRLAAKRSAAGADFTRLKTKAAGAHVRRPRPEHVPAGGGAHAPRRTKFESRHQRYQRRRPAPKADPPAPTSQPSSHRITRAISTNHRTWTAKPKPPKMASSSNRTIRAIITFRLLP